jgi:predicted DNA-binding protein with PD1-like motif
VDYQVGNIGRVIVARGYDGDNVYEEIEHIAKVENIRCGAVIVVGGLRTGNVITGPTDPNAPSEPLTVAFDDAREIAGVGTLFCDGEEPKLHLHGAIGRGEVALAGCPRGGATVFCVLEIVIIEMMDIDAARELDPQVGAKVLSLLSR